MSTNVILVETVNRYYAILRHAVRWQD